MLDEFLGEIDCLLKWLPFQCGGYVENIAANE